MREQRFRGDRSGQIHEIGGEIDQEIDFSIIRGDRKDATKSDRKETRRLGGRLLTLDLEPTPDVLAEASKKVFGAARRPLLVVQNANDRRNATLLASGTWQWRLSEASALGKTVYEYDPRSNGAVASSESLI